MTRTTVFKRSSIEGGPHHSLVRTTLVLFLIAIFLDGVIHPIPRSERETNRVQRLHDEAKALN